MLSAQLFKEAANADPNAEKEIFNLTYKSLLSTALRYVKVEADAEECIMNAYMKFFSSLRNFNYLNIAATVGFLKKCLMNECLMHLRSKKSYQIISKLDIEGKIVDNAALNNLETSYLLELIAALPIGYRTVFNLFEIEGYRHNEIAEWLGISEGTSKSQLHKAKQLLQRAIIQKQNYYAKQG